VLGVSPAPYTLRRKLHCSYNSGKADLNWECWGNPCTLDQLFTWGDQQQLSAPMGYHGGPTSMLDLTRHLKSKPTILLPDKLQLKMPRGGPRDCQGCTALMQCGSCVFLLVPVPPAWCFSLLSAGPAQLLKSQGRALWTFELGLLWPRHSWKSSAVQPGWGLESWSKLLSKVEGSFHGDTVGQIDATYP